VIGVLQIWAQRAAMHRLLPFVLALLACGCGGSHLPPLQTHAVSLAPASRHDAAPHGEAARIEDHGRHGTQLVVIDLTTGRRRVVAKSEDWRGGDAGLSDPVFSPDGSRIAVSNTRATDKDYNMVTDVLIAPVSGRAPAHPARGIHIADAKDQYGYKPSWSPDGRAILGVSEHATFLSDLATGRHHILINYADPELTFSPDGRSYMLSSAGLWRVDARTGHRHKILSDKTATSPLWSPDGTSIAYLSSKDHNGSIPGGEDTNKTYPAPEVYVTSPTGTHTHHLTTSTDSESHLLWSTDSRTLLYQLDDLSIHATCLPTSTQPDERNPQSWSLHATTPTLTHHC
jgi:Tol biopolymer transport system component